MIALATVDYVLIFAFHCLSLVFAVLDVLCWSLPMVLCHVLKLASWQATRVVWSEADVPL